MQRTTALAVVPLEFEDKEKPGQMVRMWEVYVPADDGRLGKVVSRAPVMQGQAVALETVVQDGRVKLRLRLLDD